MASGEDMFMKIMFEFVSSFLFDKGRDDDGTGSLAE